MKENVCMKCQHHTIKDTHGTHLSWCAAHDFPVHKTYTCGKFNPIPEKIKEAKVLVEYIKIPFTLGELDKYVKFNEVVKLHVLPHQKDDLCLLVGENETFRMYVVPCPKTLVELIYFMDSMRIAYEFTGQSTVDAKIEEVASTKESII